MENKQHDSHHGNNFNGFFFGVIVGIALVLLFTTKKGRQILRILADEGINRLSKWEKEMKNRGVTLQDDDEDVTDEPYIPTNSLPEKTAEQIFHEKVLEKHEHDHEENGHQAVTKVKTSGRRLFKGIPKRN